MPANLPPQYLKVEDEYRKASTPEERLEDAPRVVSSAAQAQGDGEAPVGPEAEDEPAPGRARAGQDRGQEGGAEPSRAARGGGPGGAGRSAERREEHAAGGLDQCAARDRAVSVHDPRRRNRGS